MHTCTRLLGGLENQVCQCPSTRQPHVPDARHCTLAFLQLAMTTVCVPTEALSTKLNGKVPVLGALQGAGERGVPTLQGDLQVT